MLNALNDSKVEYLVVGAHAMAAYELVRATGDFDIWVRPTQENAERVWMALEKFGTPRRKLKIEDFCCPNNVYQIGVEPDRIDILTSIDGVDFSSAWQNREQARIDGTPIPVLGREELMKNKRASGRPKDLADVAWLERTDL
jgi:hypothetical protein